MVAFRSYHVQVKNMLDIDTSLTDLGHALNILYMYFNIFKYFVLKIIWTLR